MATVRTGPPAELAKPHRPLRKVTDEAFTFSRAGSRLGPALLRTFSVLRPARRFALVVKDGSIDGMLKGRKQNEESQEWPSPRIK
jgi:hypothetical protein